MKNPEIRPMVNDAFLFEFQLDREKPVESIAYLRRALHHFFVMTKDDPVLENRWADVRRKWECGKMEVLKNSRGKPYVETEGIHLSAAHFADRVVCALSGQNVGIDGEIPESRIKPPDIEAISRRFFTPLEQEYVQEEKMEGFFQVWVRKEAYLKYVGIGLGYGLERIETRNETGFLNRIDGCRMHFEKRDRAYFAIAGEVEETVWMRGK